MKLIKHFDISGKSQEFLASPVIESSLNNTILKYDVEGDTGEYRLEGLRFQDTISYKVTSVLFTPVELFSAYDSVCEIEDSYWLDELKKNNVEVEGIYKHFAIFFEDYGCYEFISKNVSTLL